MSLTNIQNKILYKADEALGAGLNVVNSAVKLKKIPKKLSDVLLNAGINTKKKYAKRYALAALNHEMQVKLDLGTNAALRLTTVDAKPDVLEYLLENADTFSTPFIENTGFAAAAENYATKTVGCTYQDVPEDIKNIVGKFMENPINVFKTCMINIFKQK